MIISTSNDDDQLDLYVHCTLNNGSKYELVISRPSNFYAAYLNNNLMNWVMEKFSWRTWEDPPETKLFHIVSTRLLLILKKYMLYYSYQWKKTEKDYRKLLTVTASLIDSDTASLICSI